MSMYIGIDAGYLSRRRALHCDGFERDASTAYYDHSHLLPKTRRAIQSVSPVPVSNEHKYESDDHHKLEGRKQN
jgi:hypothetical protein